MEVLNSENQKSVRYAGFWLRFVAYIIDDLILCFVGFFISLPFIGSIIFNAFQIADAGNYDDRMFFGIAGIVGAVFLWKREH